MAADTQTSSQVAAGIQPKTRLGLNTVNAVFEIDHALELNDVIQMVKVPAGAKITEVILATDDLDTNGTPLLGLDVGDGSDDNRFISASTIGRTSGVARLDQVDGLNYVYAAEDTIDVSVQAAPATGATSGTIRLTVIYDTGLNSDE